jgi:PAS domain S-box-containing protein
MTKETDGEARYQAIFESAVDFAIIGLGTDGRITDWNTGAERIFGWMAEEICGQPADRFFTPEDQAGDRPGVEMRCSLAEGRATDERWHLKKDGSRFWANGEMMPLRSQAGAHIGFVKILRDRTEQRRQAEEKRLDAEFLRGVLASSDDCIKVLDLNGDLLSMTEGGMKVMEVDDFETIRGCAWTSFWTDQGNADAKAAVEAARSGGRAHFRGPAKTIAGTPKWWDVKVTPILGLDGKPEKLLAVSRDVSVQRRGEVNREALLELGDRLRDCTSTQEIAYAAGEILGRTLDVDRVGYGEVEPTTERLTIERDWTGPGIGSVEGVVHFRDYGSYIDDLRGGRDVVIDGVGTDQRADADALRQAAATALVNIPCMERGALAAILFVNQRDPREWTKAEIAFIREVANRTHAAIQRHHAETKLNYLAVSLEQQVEHRTADRNRLWTLSRDIMLVAGFDGVIVAVNPAWTATLGWSEAELMSRNFLDLVHPDDLLATQEAASALEDGISFSRFDNRYRHKDGTYRTLSWAAVPGDGLIIANARDTTAENKQSEALRHAEEALRQAQKMEAVGQLTGGLAHDFNNLLTAIMGNLELLQHRVARGRLEDLDRFINAAQGAGRRAAALTQRLLAFSRRQTLDPRPTDVNRLITGFEEMLTRTVGATVGIEIVGAVGLWATEIDAGQLENAILNLCINGRDAMPDGGTLTIETANKWLDDRAAAERDLPPGQYISVCVTDSGTGMTSDVVGRVFEPFFTTKPIGQGTGLGLSMIYGFARQSGGHVRIYSEVGQGTTVCIYLPRYHGDVVDDAAETQRIAAEAADGQTILVVDDEATIRHLIDEVLEGQGYTVIGAGDGASGLKVLQSGARIELLITDVGLPNGMNGRQVADHARVLRPGLKVLFITGFAENAAVGNGHLEPGMELLTKPFTLDALTSKVASMIKSPS